MQQMMPPDGTSIFTITLFGSARVDNVIKMLTDLLAVEVYENDDKQLVQPTEKKLPSNVLPHIAMIAVSGNETLLPLLDKLQTSSLNLEETVLIAQLENDYGPLSRVVAADSCFSPSKNYTFVAGDDDMVYHRHAVFDELPGYLWSVQRRLNNSNAAMVGYMGLHWTYPFVQWGPFVHGGPMRRRVSDATWANQRNNAAANQETMSPFCMDSRSRESTTPADTGTGMDTSSLCDNIIPTGIIECYGLVAFHRSAVTPKLYQKHHHPDFLRQCFWGDDFWLAYYAFRMNISRYIVRSRVTNPSFALIQKLPQPDGSVGKKAGGSGGNLMNYRRCEREIYNNIDKNCSWCM